MSLLFALLPIYLFGNIHCFGMCGPLVMMIGHHRWRALYFLGRILSFTLAGFFSGALGFVLQIFLNSYHVGAGLSLGFGSLLILLGLSQLFDLSLPHIGWLAKKTGRLSHHLSLLLLRDRPLPTALFGFFTLLLPCGQTLIVFSACALFGDPWVGALNGLAFALLTTPSLFLAMSLSKWLSRYKKFSSQIIGLTSLFVGLIALLRGLAELRLIPHFILSEHYHLVIW